MAMIKAEEFKDMAEGTAIWSAYPGKIVLCTFNCVVSMPSIWGNFPEDFGIDISGPGVGGLSWGTECQEFYLDEYEAKARAREWLLESRQRQMDKANEMLREAQARMDLPVMVEVK